MICLAWNEGSLNKNFRKGGISVKQVIQTLKRRDAEKRIPVLRLEIDYELATLFDAMQAEDIEQMNKSKRKLEKFRQEMLQLEA
jgi:hypothetical protein